MIIFLHGPDEYRRLQKKKEIIAEFRKKHAVVGVDVFNLAEKDELPRFRDFIGSQSLFDPKKMAVLEGAFEANEKELTAELKKSIKNPNLTVLVSEKNKSSGDFTFLSRKSVNIKTQPFDWLSGAKWEAFISDMAKERELTLQPAALKFLAEVYQDDTWGLATEIEKLSAMHSPESVEGPKKSVGMEDLKTLDLEISQDFFELLKSLKNNALENRMASLEKLFSLNEPLPKIFNMIAYQIPEKLGMLAKYDVLVKSGKLEYEEALVDLVL